MQAGSGYRSCVNPRPWWARSSSDCTALDDLLFEDLDFEVLFDPSLDGIEDEPILGPPGVVPMGFAHWFVPFRTEDRLPYADQAAPSGVGVE